MRPLITTCMTVLVGGALGSVLQAPTPVITPGAKISGVEAFMKRDEPDAVSLAKILLTAIPESLRAIAATNVPAVSSILWEEFLDDKKPEWFLELPSDVQSYLIQQFGPRTALPSATATSYNMATTSPSASWTQTQTQASESPSPSPSPSSSETAKMATSIITISMGSTGIPIAIPTGSPSASSSSSGLSKEQKIGIGIGVPLAVIAAAALLLGCCFLLRRRRKKSVNGSQPPSSPGFIPRFAFQEKGILDHNTPLNRNKHLSQDTSYSGYSNWDDDVIETMENTQRSDGATNSHPPIPTPPLYHTHSSNRARGKRTSYQSLHSVAELSEPEEVIGESPILPRESLLRQSPPRRQSGGLITGATQLKRKPVPSASPSPNRTNNGNRNIHSFGTGKAAAAPSISQNLLRQPMSDHSNSSSSNSSGLSALSGTGNQYTQPTASPVSPISDAPPKNPFSNEYSYVEDYGPEYHNGYGYVDLENGLYGGHTDLSRYPDMSAQKTSKTEWPLRNAMGHRRNKSPLWDRIYEG